jgi:hypothetical protein
MPLGSCEGRLLSFLCVGNGAAVLDFIYSGPGLGVRWVPWMALAGVA